MSTLEAIVLGIAQGLTEFLPVSSTAHLAIVPALAGWEDPGAAFTAVTQLGTAAAVLIYFRADLWRIARAWFVSLGSKASRGTLDARLGWYLIVATIPISILGLVFKHQIETSARNLYLIAAALIVFGLLLLAAERAGQQNRGMGSVTARDGMAVGLAQAVALIPGVSRSGATITAGLFLGLRREDAARFSFLLSMPAVVLSGLFELRNLLEGESPGAGGASLVVATVLAFVVGYASIALLLRFLVEHSTAVFVVYRLALGALVLALLAAGVIS